MPWMIAAVAGASIIGGIMANSKSADERQAAINQNQAAVQQWLSLHVPDPEDQKIALKQFVSQGTLTPQLSQAMQQSKTEMNQIKTDPRLRQAQMDALGSLQNEGMSGGMDLRDQAAMQNSINSSNSAARGRNQAIQSQYSQQGLGGSGLELQAQLQGAQNANQTQASTSLNAAAQSRQRALDAIMGAGQLGGQMENMQYGQQKNTASAQDAINRFNTQNSQNTANQNALWQNQANQYNLGQQQQISNANTDMSNQQQMYNKNLYQQQYQNQLARTQGAANAEFGAATNYQNQANNTANMWTGMGNSVGKGLSAYAQYQNQQPKQGNQTYGYDFSKDKEDDSNSYSGGMS